MHDILILPKWVWTSAQNDLNIEYNSDLSLEITKDNEKNSSIMVIKYLPEDIEIFGPHILVWITEKGDDSIWLLSWL